MFQKNIKNERELIGTTLISLYENPALKMLATRINNINRRKETSEIKNVSTDVKNNYTYEFENVIKRYSGCETRLVMECVIDLKQFNNFIQKCLENNITLYTFNKLISKLHTNLLFLNERYIKGSNSEKLKIISPLIAFIVNDLNENFNEYVSDITEKVT